MGKKRYRSGYQSKGERRNIIAGVREAKSSGLDKGLNKLLAWRAGKNPWITVSNPERNKPWIRVRANDYYGDPKKSYGIFSMKMSSNR